MSRRFLAALVALVAAFGATATSAKAADYLHFDQAYYICYAKYNGAVQGELSQYPGYGGGATPDARYLARFSNTQVRVRVGWDNPFASQTVYVSNGYKIYYWTKLIDCTVTGPDATARVTDAYGFAPALRNPLEW